jgi:hypothetical protein
MARLKSLSRFCGDTAATSSRVAVIATQILRGNGAGHRDQSAATMEEKFESDSKNYDESNVNGF